MQKAIDRMQEWYSFRGGEGAARVARLQSCAPNVKVINCEMREANLGYSEQVHP